MPSDNAVLSLALSVVRWLMPRTLTVTLRDAEADAHWRANYAFRSMMLSTFAGVCAATAAGLVGPAIYSGCADSNRLPVLACLVGLPLMTWHVNWLCHHLRWPMEASRAALLLLLLALHAAIVATHIMAGADEAWAMRGAVRGVGVKPAHPPAAVASTAAVWTCELALHTRPQDQNYLMQMVDYLLSFICLACLLRSYGSRALFAIGHSAVWALDSATYDSFTGAIPVQQRAWNWLLSLLGEMSVSGSALVIALALEHAQSLHVTRRVEKALLHRRVAQLEQEREKLLWDAQREQADHQADRSRNARLLRQLFPPDTMAELLHTGGSLARGHENATLLFADLVGFTAWSSAQPPGRVFAALGQYYQLLDSYCDDLGGYKVETVGDCYVASFGIFEELEAEAEDDDESAARKVGVGGKGGEKGNVAAGGWRSGRRRSGALRAIEMGLRICEFSVQALRKICEDESISVRVGVHTGPLCSGILKLSRPRWQLFGDTINMASRMESTGAPNRVHISEAALTAVIEEAASGRGEEATDARGEACDLGRSSSPSSFIGGSAAYHQSLRPLRFHNLGTSTG